MHPTSKKLLPPPVNTDPMEDLPAGLAEQYRASEVGRLHAATEQDLNPKMKLMLERVWKGSVRGWLPHVVCEGGCVARPIRLHVSATTCLPV